MRILFVCLGNICRSTMAQSVMTHLVWQADIDDWTIDSAGTSDEETGNPPHAGTQRKLAEVGVAVVPHRARQMSDADYGAYDLIVYMDKQNEAALLRRFGGDADGKLRALLSFAPASYTKGRTEVADPWWTGNFDATYDDIMAGCTGILETYTNT